MCCSMSHLLEILFTSHYVADKSLIHSGEENKTYIFMPKLWNEWKFLKLNFLQRFKKNPFSLMKALIQTICWHWYNQKNFNLQIGESANHPYLKMSIRKNVHAHSEKITIWNHGEILAKNKEVLSNYNIKFSSSSESNSLHILM